MIATTAFHLDLHLHLHLHLDFDFFPPSSDEDLSPLPSPPLSNTSIEYPYRIACAILSRREESDIRHLRETFNVAVTVIRGLVYIQQDAQAIKEYAFARLSCHIYLIHDSFIHSLQTQTVFPPRTTFFFLFFLPFLSKKDKFSPNSSNRTQGKSLKSVECIYVPQGASSYEIMRCAEQSCMAGKVLNRPCNACYLVLSTSTRTTRDGPRRGTCMLGFSRAKLYYSFFAIRQRPSWCGVGAMSCHEAGMHCRAFML